MSYPENDETWKEKLQHYDYIEGFSEDIEPDSCLYKRVRITATIFDDKNKWDSAKKVSDIPRENEVETFIYIRTKCQLDEPIECGDWLKRKR